MGEYQLRCALAEATGIITALKERVKETETENTRLDSEWRKTHDWNSKLVSEHYVLNKALENIIIWAEGSTCEICGKKEMINTDAYYYAKAALGQRVKS